jgi:hypothetical protein
MFVNLIYNGCDRTINPILKYLFMVYVNSSVICFLNSGKARIPSLLWELQSLHVVYDISGQPIDFILKDQALTFYKSEGANTPRQKPEISRCKSTFKVLAFISVLLEVISFMIFKRGFEKLAFTY